ncbi:MAG TPA: DUF364 domain-containing protein [Methanocorpusculum sp.]|nr:DUF364 domain-containing protein [Methanocorpusculum sp.]
MWELYDALIDEIPEDITVEQVFVGAESTYVINSIGGFGYAGFRDYYQRAPMVTKNRLGTPLKEAAACIKSWNFREASIGHAAICSYYNSRSVAEKNGIEILEKKRVEERLKDPFISSQNKVKGKKAVIVGHFPFIENLLGPVCDMSIIEWDPYEGDYPYSAIEYLLPEADFAFLTCAGFGDKTMEHMLELAENAEEITIVGPATPLAPQLFDFGVTDLSGFVVTDNAFAARVTSGAENARIFDTGRKVSFKAPGK